MTARPWSALLSTKAPEAFRIFALIVFCIGTAIIFRSASSLPSDRAIGCDAFGYLR